MIPRRLSEADRCTPKTKVRCVGAPRVVRIGLRLPTPPLSSAGVYGNDSVGRHQPGGFQPLSPTRRPNRRALAVALAILLVPVTAGAVSAGYGKPTIVLRASVSDGTPFVEVVVSRQSKQIDSCAYVLDSDAPADCGWRLGSATHTRFTLVPSDPSVGDHTVTVTIVLTDGERLTNSISFTIAEPPTGAGL